MSKFMNDLFPRKCNWIFMLVKIVHSLDHLSEQSFVVLLGSCMPLHNLDYFLLLFFRIVSYYSESFPSN